MSLSVKSFRTKARKLLNSNMTPKSGAPEWNEMNVSLEQAERARELQSLLHKGGYAGLCFPREYGGQGLTPEYQAAFNEESKPYELPLVFNIPTLAIIAPLLPEMGSESQERRCLPRMISGQDLWMQFMSEPSGGSDMAGSITRATFDGRDYLLNGAKIWSSYAYFSDYAVCLARTLQRVLLHEHRHQQLEQHQQRLEQGANLRPDLPVRQERPEALPERVEIDPDVPQRPGLAPHDRPAPKVRLDVHAVRRDQRDPRQAQPRRRLRSEIHIAHDRPPKWTAPILSRGASNYEI